MTRPAARGAGQAVSGAPIWLRRRVRARALQQRTHRRQPQLGHGGLGVERLMVKGEERTDRHAPTTELHPLRRREHAKRLARLFKPLQLLQRVGALRAVAPQPQVVVAGDEKYERKRLREEFHRLGEARQRVAHVASDEEDVARVALGGQAPHPLEVLSIIGVHVAHRVD
eukprot:3153326-Prymnesium_polylepis.2